MNADAFCENFGLLYPILQAPTGSIAGPELAAAVSAAGGMGAMGLTWADPDVARGQVQWVRDHTDRVFQVNFVLAFPPNALTASLEAGAPVVTFSWGDAAPHIPHVRSFGARVGVQVTNVAGARHALDCGADFLICQGVEAGGHVQSTTPLNDLLPRIVAVAGEVPVASSGGIGTGAQVAHVLRLGACAAMLGTRFVAAAESQAHDDYKNRLVGARSAETALTVCFDGGWPYAAHRVLRNATLEQWEAMGSPPPGRRPGEGDVIARAASDTPIGRYEDTAPRAGMTGDVLEMCLYAGTSVGAVERVAPAAEIIADLMREYNEV